MLQPGLTATRLDAVECLDGEGAKEWWQLAHLPLHLNSRGGVYFKQRILLVEVKTTLAFTPTTTEALANEST